MILNINIFSDTFGDSEEMFAYLDTDISSSDDEHRQLCLDALVEEGDINHDWRLDFQEFKNIFSSFYKPSSKGDFCFKISRISLEPL